ncbi:MAG TPA: hypothetical protein VEC57_12100 [Candidatus Limnocylindrales bacterium]|nr:hypothetical protein [Candidatus Limnocylindrales bacterium]
MPVMAERRWELLVRDLEARGYRSEYLDRLRQRLPLEDAVDDIRREIVREAASALSRAALKVDHALLELELCGHELEAATTFVERYRLEVRFNELREKALRVRHELAIHREALGMRRNDALERLYPVPPRVRIDIPE